MLEQGPYRLRAMEPQDAHLLYQWENRADEWWLGAQLAPISLEAMQRFAGGDHDVWTDRQLRLMLDCDGQTTGAFDLYDIDPRNRRAGIGLAIGRAFRGRGHARTGLELLLRYAFGHLNLRMVFAEVPMNNPSSLELFRAAGFSENGRLEKWVRHESAYVDLALMQAFGPDE